MKKDSLEDKDKIVAGGTGYNPSISVKKAGRIILYPVTINELKELRKKSDGDTILNFFFCFSTAFASFFIAYLTCSFDSLYKEMIFLFASFLFAILGIVTLVWWILVRKKSDELYNEIINREDAD